MIRLIIILLVIYMFIRFYKRISFITPGRGTTGRRTYGPQDSDGDPKKRFDDIEEAEYVEVDEESKTKSEASEKQS